MRKILPVLALLAVFATGFAVGYDAPPAAAAGSSSCFWTCGCNGVPIKCCITPLGVVCKPDPRAPIGCPQIADC